MKFLLLSLMMALSYSANAEEVILAPDDFLQRAFVGDLPPPSTVWLSGELGVAAREILGHAPHSLRVRYWRQAPRSAWILEEIGKESPITAGFVVENGQLQDTAVLIYRETRGSEIRFRSFLEQFIGQRLAGSRLDRSIDNVSSATLSVRAMKRMAALALLLDARSD